MKELVYTQEWLQTWLHIWGDMTPYGMLCLCNIRHLWPLKWLNCISETAYFAASKRCLTFVLSSIQLSDTTKNMPVKSCSTHSFTLWKELHLYTYTLLKTFMELCSFVMDKQCIVIRIAIRSTYITIYRDTNTLAIPIPSNSSEVCQVESKMSDCTRNNVNCQVQT